MFCPKCGSNVPEGVVFCANCGSNVTEAPAQAPVQAPPKPPMDPAKKKKIILFSSIGAVVAIALIVVLILVLTAPKTYVLDDYIKVSFSGYDTLGNAQLDVDMSEMYETLSEKMSKKKQKKLAELLGAGFDIQLDKTRNLANGDTVILEWEADAELLKDLNIKLKISEAEFVVGGLDPVTVVDPFEYVEITYEGYDPNVTAQMNVTLDDEFLEENIWFYLEDHYELSEGDTFKAFASIDTEYVKNYGYIITATEKEYTATGLPQPEPLDPFELLSYSFLGVSGEGELIYEVAETEDDFLSNVGFRFDKDWKLSTGDEITCTLSYWNDPIDYGYTLTREQMTITVPELGKYVNSPEQLSEDLLTQLEGEALEAVKAYYEQQPSDYVYTEHSIFGITYSTRGYSSISDFELIQVLGGNYTPWSTPYNYLCFLFTMEGTGHSNAAANGTLFTYVYLQDLILLPDGTLEGEWSFNCVGSAYTTYDLLLTETSLYYFENVVSTTWESPVYTIIVDSSYGDLVEGAVLQIGDTTVTTGAGGRVYVSLPTAAYTVKLTQIPEAYRLYDSDTGEYTIEEGKYELRITLKNN